ncbi:MAG: hypothetical protein AB8H80_15775 [Planctomycetota bacterium]
MEADALILKKLVERVLDDDGRVPLSLLLQHFVPVEELRAVAQKLGITPKGGFRIERAPAKVLAQKLGELRQNEPLEEVLKLLLAQRGGEAPGGDAAVEIDAELEQARAAEARALLALRDGEALRLRGELERARGGAQRARQREVELERALSDSEERLLRARRSLEEVPSAVPVEEIAPSRDERALERRLHELVSEREGYMAADEARRRQLARDRSRMRELEDEVAELESLIPASRRRKKKPMLDEPEPVSQRRFLMPYFQPSFYKSLEGKERRAIERALQAVLLFCHEGHGYPGLEVKPMGGQDTWSLRASLGLRVYFRPRASGDIDVLELGDREEQHTTLRRLKDK